VIECRFCDFSLGNIILDIEIITAESLDLRDKNDLFFLLNIESYQQGEPWIQEKISSIEKGELSLVVLSTSFGAHGCILCKAVTTEI